MKNLLIAQDLQPMLMSAMSFLHRADIAVHTAASNDDILRLHLEKNGHLIATHPGLPGMPCKTLCDIIRRGESLKKVSILLLCETTPLQQEQARQCKVNVVLTRPVDTALFAGKVQQLLDIPPRHAYRVLLNIAVEGMQDRRPVMCHAENISASGMLIRAKERLASGNPIVCSFYLPDGSRVSANGAIVRSFKKDPLEDMTYYGISFQTFAPGAKEAIASFVERESNRQAELPIGAAKNA